MTCIKSARIGAGDGHHLLVYLCWACVSVCALFQRLEEKSGGVEGGKKLSRLEKEAAFEATPVSRQVWRGETHGWTDWQMDGWRDGGMDSAY